VPFIAIIVLDAGTEPSLNRHRLYPTTMSESVVLTTDEGEESVSLSGFIHIISFASRDYIACEFCREPLHELSVENRQTHYEAHFNNGDGLEVNELDAQLAVSERFFPQWLHSLC
jgi:hypothetical protein